MALTKEEAVMVVRLEEISRKVTELRMQRREVLRGHTCRVDAKENPSYISAGGWKDWGGARCCICNVNHGWYCPDSPDHSCHYSQSYDSCDHCGEPEERK
jgi:hypothetical protein